jgi:hypothetical protein
MEQTLFWFVHARHEQRHVKVAVAAFTERSARVQARKLLNLSQGSQFTIEQVSPVTYAHAWVIDYGWLGAPRHADAVGQPEELPHLSTRA